MTVLYILLAASPVLLLTAAAFFVFIVIGVRRGSRSDLSSPTQNRIDAITRRIIGVGVRSDSNDNESR